jgi:soluble lytic murein transglycosylase
MKRSLYLFLFFFCACLPLQLHSQDQEPREVFSRAYALYSQGKQAEAESLFAQTRDRGFPLEDYSLYFLGLIRLSAKDWANGRSYFSHLKQKFPQSIWSSQADLQLARISLEEKDYLRAIGELRALQTSSGKKKEIAERASYLLGQAYEMQGELKRAHAAYQELRQSSPLSRWAAQARREIRRLREQQPEQFGLNTADALASEADLLLREREYGEAERAYRKLLEPTAESKRRARFLMGLANVYRALRKRDEAVSVLTEIVDQHPDSSEASNALYRLALAYWNRDDNPKALEHFNQLRQRYPKGAFVDFAHFASARIYEDSGKREDALRLYREFPKRFPDSKWLTEAIWREAWMHYLQADYNQAKTSFKRLAALPAAESSKNAALYWQGRTAEKLDRPEEAKQLFLQILNGREDTYYKGPAEKRLAGLGALSEGGKGASPLPAPEPSPSLQTSFSFHLSRAHELAQISLDQLAVSELDEIQRLSAGDPASSLMLLREYTRNKAYSRSVSLANQIQTPYADLERYRYPLAYWDTVQKTAEERGIDPYLVLALIRQESLFDPKALSSAFAYGLMQLLPSTATRTASQLGLPSPQPEKLFEPDLNLNLGIYHLKELLQLYPGDPVKAIAAYNAGQNAVARWERQFVTDDPEEFVERIPYGETRLYVKLVLRNHLNYRRIYGNFR